MEASGYLSLRRENHGVSRCRRSLRPLAMLPRPRWSTSTLARALTAACAAGIVSLASCKSDSACQQGIAAPQRSLTPSPADFLLDVGDSRQVTATLVGFCQGASTAIQWTSSAPAIATVSRTGAVTAVGAGSAVLSGVAEADDRVVTSVPVTVRPPAVQSVTTTPSTLRLRERQTSQLRTVVATTGGLTRRVTFRSLQPSVATVQTSSDSVSAIVTAVGVGQTAIEVVPTGDAARVSSVAVTVDPALVATVTISGLPDSLAIGGRTAVRAIVRDSGGVELSGRVVRWTSETPMTATITAQGEVQAVGVGTIRIVASVPVGDGISGDRTGTAATRGVGELRVSVQPRTAEVEVGRTRTLTVAVTAGSVVDRSVTWESSANAVATVSLGVVTAESPGRAVVRARSAALPQIVDSAVISVVAPSVETTVEAAPRNDTLFVRGSRILSATVRDQRGVALPGSTVS